MHLEHALPKGTLHEAAIRPEHAGMVDPHACWEQLLQLPAPSSQLEACIARLHTLGDPHIQIEVSQLRSQVVRQAAGPAQRHSCHDCGSMESWVPGSLAS